MSDCKETFLLKYEVNVFFQAPEKTYMVIYNNTLCQELYMLWDDECLWDDGAPVTNNDWRKWLFDCPNSPLYKILGGSIPLCCKKRRFA